MARNKQHDMNDDIQDAYDEMRKNEQGWQQKGGRAMRDVLSEGDDLSDMDEEWIEDDN